jgi:hypothetical protein
MKTPIKISQLKFVWILIKIGIIVALLAAIMSCTKEKEYDIPTPVEKVKVFVSTSSSQN